MSAVFAVLRRDLALAIRTGGAMWLALAFFAGVVLLVPLGIGVEHAMLARIAPGILWIGAALSVLLSLDRLFQADYEDGSLDQIMLADAPMPLVVLAKAAAAWLTTGLPLALASPFFALQLQMGAEATGVLLLSLVLGTPILTLIGTIGAALTLSIRRGGLLLSLLVLPLYVPPVIFGAGAASAAALGLPYLPALLILGGLTLFALVLAPLAAAAAVRLNLG